MRHIKIVLMLILLAITVSCTTKEEYKKRYLAKYPGYSIAYVDWKSGESSVFILTNKELGNFLYITTSGDEVVVNINDNLDGVKSGKDF